MYTSLNGSSLIEDTEITLDFAKALLGGSQFVGVRCPLEELEMREQQRGARKRGMARLQFDQVHAQALYDVEVDTSKLGPQECASRITDYMGTRRYPSAFERLRERSLS